jgi:hypothetical protein
VRGEPREVAFDEPAAWVHATPRRSAGLRTISTPLGEPGDFPAAPVDEPAIGCRRLCAVTGRHNQCTDLPQARPARLNHPSRCVNDGADRRRAVRAYAPENAVDLADLAERLMIAATELAGNALRHGKPPTIVALLRADGHLIIDVTDNDPTSRRPPPTLTAHPAAAASA